MAGWAGAVQLRNAPVRAPHEELQIRERPRARALEELWAPRPCSMSSKYKPGMSRVYPDDTLNDEELDGSAKGDEDDETQVRAV